MKKKKRNTSKTGKKYEKFYCKFEGRTIAQNTSAEFYGLIKKDGRVKIDIKRMKKVKTSGVPTEILDMASQIPRNTTYFLPAKVERHDYISNRFRDALSTLREKWHENKAAFSKINTPDTVGSEVRIDALSSGFYDYDEAEEKGTIAKIKRTGPYYELFVASHANFIHQIASEMMALMLREARTLGYTYPDVSRNKLETYIEGTIQGRRKISELPHYKCYNDFYTVWNLLKHNSEELFDKVKNRCPEMLLSNTYTNGQLSQYILKIDDGYIENVLSELELFFDEFCEAFFNENVEYSRWNYDEYFTDIIQKTIDEIINPLDI